MTGRDVLVQARALIEDEQRWCKHHYYANGRYCAVGALRGIQNEHLVVPSVYFEARDALDIACGEGAGHFNDDPHTTHQDVLDAFDRAIASFEAPVEPVAGKSGLA